MGDTLKKGERDSFQKFSDGIRNAPNSIFDFGEDKTKYVQSFYHLSVHNHIMFC